MREKKQRDYEITYRLARPEFAHQLDRAMGYMTLGPILLVAIVVGVVVGGMMLYSVFGWFATIPSWAAVIIVLLVLILLKLK